MSDFIWIGDSDCEPGYSIGSNNNNPDNWTEMKEQMIAIIIGWADPVEVE